MEANILTLLQGASASDSSSKWKDKKIKHDVTFNKKDFPLNSAEISAPDKKKKKKNR